MEKTSTVAMVRACNIPISFILQAAFLQKPDVLQCVGTLMVFLAIICSNIDFSFIRGWCCSQKSETEKEKEVEEASRTRKISRRASVVSKA